MLMKQIPERINLYQNTVCSHKKMFLQLNCQNKVALQQKSIVISPTHWGKVHMYVLAQVVDVILFHTQLEVTCQPLSM